MSRLRISPTLRLTDDFVTKTAAILAQRRKGKTYTASVIAEELVAAKLPFVVLDPTGAWWGLRSSADGQRAGLPVVILGGQHGDVPLERTGGRLVAELVVDQPGYYVIDFSLFESGAAESQFAADFAERLYRRKGEADSDFPLHLFVDEADRFIPQQPKRRGTDEASPRLVGALEAIVRRGGLRGLGTTLISQRAAVVNKNVLEQVDLLIVLRTVGPNDQRAIDGYIKAHGTDKERATLLGSLASLKLGEAWIWEPGAEPSLFERIQIRERRSFNSSATPKAGERRIEPRKLADVDLAALKERMGETIERAKQKDPEHLRRRVAELERDLARSAARTEKVQVEVPVEVPVEVVPRVVEDWVGVLNGLVSDLDEMRERALQVMNEATTALDVRERELGRFRQGVRDDTQRQEVQPVAPARGRSSRAAGATAARGTRPSAPPAGNGAVKLGKGEKKVLAVMAQWPDGRTYNELAFLAGYSAKASTLGVILSALRKVDYIEPGNQPVRLTAAGLAAAGGAQPLPTGPALLSHWLQHPRMGEGERTVLSKLVELYPDTPTHEELCAETGYSPDASTMGVILSKLRKLGLVEKKARRCLPEFMDAIR